MFRRKSKKKELDDFFDVECGRQGQTQDGQKEKKRSSKFFLESQVTSALEMAQVAMASLRRRAEQSEGEAILLSVQLQDEKETNQKRRLKLEAARNDLEQKLRKGRTTIEELQKAVAEGVVQNARMQQDMVAQAQQSKIQLSNLHNSVEEKELEIKQLKSENIKLESELVRMREQEEKLKSSGTKSNSNSNPKNQESLSSEDVSAAALTLARALAQSGFEGLETEASATASAALNLAAALGPNPNVNHNHGTMVSAPQGLEEASADNLNLNQNDVCVTPQVMQPQHKSGFNNHTMNHPHNQENVNPFLTMSKGKRGYMTAPEHHSFAASAGGGMNKSSSSRKGSGTSASTLSMKKRLPLSTSKKMNQNTTSTTSSPWAQPLSATLGQFLSWNRPTNSPGTGRKRVTAPKVLPEDVAVDVDLEYSVTSWQ